MPLDNRQRRTIEDWIDKAGNCLQTAQGFSENRYRYPESIQQCQECVELSVKGILVLLGIEYPRTHGWNKEQLAKIAEQIHKRRILERIEAQNPYLASKLPRLLFLANFWAQFYLEAKYGIEPFYLASAQNLFDKPEVDAALAHARECHNAALNFKGLDMERFNT